MRTNTGSLCLHFSKFSKNPAILYCGGFVLTKCTSEVFPGANRSSYLYLSLSKSMAKSSNAVIALARITGRLSISIP